MIHELKILPKYLEAILSGDKSFEVRSIVDRSFNAGDELRLREFDPEMHNRSASGYSGREVTVRSHMCSQALFIMVILQWS